MAGYETKTESLAVDGSADLMIRSLKDRLQFDDDDGRAARAGVSEALWPIFGLVWESGRILAELMAQRADDGGRVLEIGCGLGLSSMVMQRAGCDITASDIHPMAHDFLNVNAALNGVAAIPFHVGDWATLAPELGLFDCIIGSDVLYDQSHAPALAGFISRHAKPVAEVIIVDPNRRQRADFRRRMEDLDFALSAVTAPGRDFGDGAYRGQILSFTRVSAGAPLV